jgi:hypothetical protein
MIGASFEREEIYECRKCGPIHPSDSRQAERDEVCLVVCRRCDSIVDVYADMDAYLYDEED